MKRKLWILPALLALVVPFAIAGGDHYKCTKSTQECLDAMAAKYAKKGWLGVELDGDKESMQMTVKKVIAESPAEKAGLKAGDVLVAMDGLRFAEENKEKLEEAWMSLKPGKQVKYTVSRYGKEVDVTAKLGKVPSEVMAQWVGTHMLSHTKSAEVAQN